MCEKRVHCSLLRAVFAKGDRVCRATSDCVHVGSVVKVHEGTGRYSVNFGEDEQANGREVGHPTPPRPSPLALNLSVALNLTPHPRP